MTGYNTTNSRQIMLVERPETPPPAESIIETVCNAITDLMARDRWQLHDEDLLRKVGIHVTITRAYDERPCKHDDEEN